MPEKIEILIDAAMRLVEGLKPKPNPAVVLKIESILEDIAGSATSEREAKALVKNVVDVFERALNDSVSHPAFSIIENSSTYASMVEEGIEKDRQGISAESYERMIEHDFGDLLTIIFRHEEAIYDLYDKFRNTRFGKRILELSEEFYEAKKSLEKADRISFQKLPYYGKKSAKEIEDIMIDFVDQYIGTLLKIFEEICKAIAMEQN